MGNERIISNEQAMRIATNKYGDRNIKHIFNVDSIEGMPALVLLVKDRLKTDCTYLIIDRTVDPQDFYEHDEADVHAHFERNIMEALSKVGEGKVHLAVMQFKGPDKQVLMRLWHLAD